MASGRSIIMRSDPTYDDEKLLHELTRTGDDERSVIVRKDNGDVVIRAFNQGGYDFTEVFLNDVIDSLKLI